MSEDNQSKENKPQMKAPIVTSLQSCASGERVHVCPAGAYVLFGSREPLGFGLENPQGFGIDERRCGLDFFGSLGKGMLAKENLETLGNSSGLTPLSFGVNARNKIMDINPVTDGFSTTEFTERREIFKDSYGLTPLRPFGKNHNKEVLE